CCVCAVRMTLAVRDAAMSPAHSSEFEYELASVWLTNRSAVKLYASRCNRRGDADDKMAPGTSWKKKSLSRAGPFMVGSSGALSTLSVQPAVAVVVACSVTLARAGAATAPSA